MQSVVAFADGENLVLRYEEMLRGGRTPLPEMVVHEPRVFVWSSLVSKWTSMDLVRITYYTSVVGSDERVLEVKKKIASTRFEYNAGTFRGSGQIVPRIHKKLAASRKTKVVDVDITMDVMRATLDPSVAVIFLLTGDGDYAPLLSEITSRTSKQVYLGAFSSGLSPDLATRVDDFVDLDRLFFKETAD
ncbi:MAG TPA: NYN domain-containing protein [Stenomitos sp.]